MQRPVFYSVLLLAAIFLLGGLRPSTSTIVLDPAAAVADVLLVLGDTPLPHQADTSLRGVSVAVGRALVQEGIAPKPGGGTTRKQSRHFVCTSCHNLEREDPDLSIADPQARLLYVRDHGMPFLQGTALYGAVNRSRFYNGFYEKKYGDLVRPARNDLREAIQLCAVECSQGRRLADWELESVLAYLWTIDLKVGDLILSEAEKKQIEAARPHTKAAQEAIQLIKSKYLAGAPATFVAPPDDRSAGYPEITGNPANGALLYQLSCLHCHANGRYAFFELDESKFTFKYLARHLDQYTRYSLYQVTRWGTQPLQGRRSYMPNYTAEKMSRQQLEDLRAYIEQQAAR